MTLPGPVTALAGSPDIEDCKWHVLEVKWQPAEQYNDGKHRWRIAFNASKGYNCFHI
jgi:hypothetical protein